MIRRKIFLAGAVQCVVRMVTVVRAVGAPIPTGHGEDRVTEKSRVYTAGEVQRSID